MNIAWLRQNFLYRICSWCETEEIELQIRFRSRDNFFLPQTKNRTGRPKNPWIWIFFISGHTSIILWNFSFARRNKYKLFRFKVFWIWNKKVIMYKHQVCERYLLCLLGIIFWEVFISKFGLHSHFIHKAYFHN